VVDQPVATADLADLYRLQQTALHASEAIIAGEDLDCGELNALAAGSRACPQLVVTDGVQRRQLIWTDTSLAAALARSLIEELNALEPTGSGVAPARNATCSSTTPHGPARADGTLKIPADGVRDNASTGREPHPETQTRPSRRGAQGRSNGPTYSAHAHAELSGLNRRNCRRSGDAFCTPLQPARSTAIEAPPLLVTSAVREEIDARPAELRHQALRDATPGSVSATRRSADSRRRGGVHEAPSPGQVIASARAPSTSALNPCGARRDDACMTRVEPELWVGDPTTAIDFYVRAFGATVLHRVGQGNEIVAQLAVGDARFWVSNSGGERLDPVTVGGSTSRMLLVIVDPEAVVAQAVAAGAKEVSGVKDEHGWRLGRVVDPSGHEWELGHPLGDWPPT
jgi:PhnB protein